jgi:hypothetical protein
MEWIKTTEQLPPDDTDCWIVVQNRNGTHSVAMAHYKNEWWWQHDDEIALESVTHWMLIAPPDFKADTPDSVQHPHHTL